MKMHFKTILDKLLGKHLALRVRLFNILALTGIAISVVMAITGVFTRAGILNVLVNLATAGLSLGLLYYSYTSGQYQRCYIITVVGIFLVLFPALFFSAGGYHSGMPAFFIFGVLFTAFMLEGPAVYIFTTLEIIVYTGICILAYLYPSLVTHFDTEEAVFTDILVGFLTACVTLGATMILHFRIHNTQQRELEQAREEAVHHSEVKTAFLANMSHEIRTPINVILGMNEMILREGDSGAIAEYSGSIQSAGRTLLTLVNNILDVSKIESGKLDVIEEDYQVQELIHDLAMIGRERAEKKGLAFLVEVRETLPRALTGDFIHIKQIILNYLSNAVKYTHEGAVTLHIGGAPAPEDPGTYLLRISVVDTGIGIQEKNLPFLFDSFTRVDLPSHRDIEGTGLGLAIAKQLSDLMGGRIHVESKWGEGSEFGLELPQAIQDGTPLGPWQKLPGQAAARNENGFLAPEGRVLIVDDNEENLQVIKSLLSRTLLHVHTAASGRACLDAARACRYHLIIMDFMMPDLDGVETMRRLKKEIPGFDTPVIALTATAVTGIEDLFLSEGFAAYLSKPVAWQDLERTLQAHLPPALLIRTEHAPTAPISERQLQKLGAELLPFGIRMEDGLRYLSGDILQYKKLAAFFTEYHMQSLQEVERLSRLEDLPLLTHHMHALKSKAKAIGAGGLSATAARAEAGCKAGDTQYIRLVLPVLQLEWERAEAGMELLITRLNAWTGNRQPPAPSRRHSPERLLGHLAACRHRDAEEELQLWLRQAGPGPQQALLLQAKDALQALEFEEAAVLIRRCTMTKGV